LKSNSKNKIKSPTSLLLAMASTGVEIMADFCKCQTAAATRQNREISLYVLSLGDQHFRTPSGWTMQALPQFASARTPLH
jgi:hypothetical protein